MKQSPDEARLRAFLLGDLPAAERDAMEADIFADKEVFYRLSEIEDRLIDDYARGVLTGEERLRFEQLYLTNPARRQRVEFARALTSALDRQSDTPVTANTLTPELAAARVERQRWWLSLLELLRARQTAWTVMTVCLGLLAVAVGWLWLERSRLQAELTQTRLAYQAANERQRELEVQLAALPRPVSNPLPSPTATVTSQPTPPTSTEAVLAFTLNVFALRGETNNATDQFEFPSGTKRLQLRLPLLKHDFSRYRISLHDSNARLVFRSNPLAANATANPPSLTVNLPVNRLFGDAYVLTLEGISENGEFEPVGKKQFRLTRR